MMRRRRPALRTLARLAHRPLRRAALTVLVVAALSGCSSIGPTDNPVARKLIWFSYLSGDDLRARCGVEDGDRYRVVFNADYNQHIRTYDIATDPTDGGSALVEARVIEATNLARLTPLDPLSAARGQTGTLRLTAPQFASVLARLKERGAFEPPTTTLRLPSSGIYWLINGCRGGRWFFAVHPYPASPFRDAAFLEPTRALDPQTIPFPALPAPDTAATAATGNRHRLENGVSFDLTADRDGLVGPTAPFGRWLPEGALAELLNR
ncbi:hypothetical protein [Azospirillum griseum]|uniref:Uncharacterized protein n=1 Tax=Azospirillum griseum TaxID=2496639 RepID=A0A3S0JLW0_9PROT|nr:hypothetical protein [Azospirillum griseum]RTR24320.1 hypothetical protein EJ903_00610 [Azospirillum griseum]